MVQAVSNELVFIISSWFSCVDYFFNPTGLAAARQRESIGCVANICSYMKSSPVWSLVLRDTDFSVTTRWFIF